jgi:peroxiredoxin Q/BCP
MIDPPKATKGRRMSKKTRKNSSKSGSSSPPLRGTAAAAKKSAAKTRPAPIVKAKGSGKSAESSRKTVLKPAPAPAARVSKQAAKPAVKKPTGKSTEAAIAKPAAKPALAEGAKAPAFKLPRDGGGSLSLTDFSGKNLVLFFYPRADTPGCTREAIDFTRLAGQFEAANTALLGVSADPVKAQEAFRNKHQLVTPLVSDEQHEILEAYGVWGEKSMYGKTFKGIVRTTFVVGGDGRVIRVWRKVKVDGHADEVLAAVQAL